ncbi:hypothetical protein COLO4_19296 [Corchorus olitorius]|uniref:Uncharacterized protein n=1 Tax=Corchorus olitorius TaxID=93759 RepID=A0A1R3J5W7_9ROSI|nr:hypothetical protein COLO4_19296 [Corchorus olitorius]
MASIYCNNQVIRDSSCYGRSCSKAQACLQKILRTISTIPSPPNPNPFEKRGFDIDLNLRLGSCLNDDESTEDKSESLAENSFVGKNPDVEEEIEEKTGTATITATDASSDVTELQKGDEFKSGEVKTAAAFNDSLDLLIEAAEMISERDYGANEEKEKEKEVEKSGGSSSTMEIRNNDKDNSVVNVVFGEFEDISPVVRSKRGRSQVLPHRFRDSVLEPLKKQRPQRSAAAVVSKRKRRSRRLGKQSHMFKIVSVSMDSHKFLGVDKGGGGYSKAQMCLQKILTVICSVPPHQQVISEDKPPFQFHPRDLLQLESSSSSTSQDKAQSFVPRGFLIDLNLELTSSPEETQTNSVPIDQEEKRNPVSETNLEDEKSETMPFYSRGIGQQQEEEGALTLLIETGEGLSSANGESEGDGLSSELGTQEIKGKEAREKREVDLHGRSGDELSQSQVVRTRRGRLRVLPCRYKDSVLIQPLARNTGSTKRRRLK